MKIKCHFTLCQISFVIVEESIHQSHSLLCLWYELGVGAATARGVWISYNFPQWRTSDPNVFLQAFKVQQFVTSLNSVKKKAVSCYKHAITVQGKKEICLLFPENSSVEKYHETWSDKYSVDFPDLCVLGITWLLVCKGTIFLPMVGQCSLGAHCGKGDSRCWVTPLNPTYITLGNIGLLDLKQTIFWVMKSLAYRKRQTSWYVSQTQTKTTSGHQLYACEDR